MDGTCLLMINLSSCYRLPPSSRKGEKRDAQILKVVKLVGGKKVKKAHTVSTRPSAFKTL